MRTKLSRCLRKKRFNAGAEALAYAHAAGLDLRPYRCDRCRRFHLTQRTKGKWIGLPLTRSDEDRSGRAPRGELTGGGDQPRPAGDRAGAAADALGAV